MPRRTRLVLPDTPLHIIQHGNNRQACFFADDDFQFYLEWLAAGAKRTGCRIHAYVLMTNHVHLLLSAGTVSGPGALMKFLGQRYAQYVNRTYRRSGTLWEGRYRSSLTREEAYVLACHRYIELNPVRAGMVEHPGEYRWSSFGANAHGRDATVLEPHELYLALGRDDAERRAAYRELFRHALEPGVVDQIRDATNGNYALGSERFAADVTRQLGRRAARGRAGRPKKSTSDDTPDLFGA